MKNTRPTQQSVKAFRAVKLTPRKVKTYSATRPMPALKGLNRNNKCKTIQKNKGAVNAKKQYTGIGG
jgi:hypothetical protein